MSIKKNAIVLTLAMASTGCAFMPVTDSDQPYAANCEMYTKMLTLDKPREAKVFSCQKNMHGGDFLGCLLIAGIVVPAGSFVLSGSIVLVNNSLHWLEYQGTCDKREVAENVDVFKEQQQNPPQNDL